MSSFLASDFTGNSAHKTGIVSALFREHQFHIVLVSRIPSPYHHPKPSQTKTALPSLPNISSTQSHSHGHDDHASKSPSTQQRRSLPLPQPTTRTSHPSLQTHPPQKGPSKTPGSLRLESQQIHGRPRPPTYMSSNPQRSSAPTLQQ